MKKVLLITCLASSFATYASEEFFVNKSVSAMINFNEEQGQLDALYKEGVILPNQPLNLSDTQRILLRDHVQSLIDEQSSAGGMRIKSYERDTLNAMLFNYGLQLLDDGRVVIIDVFTPNEYPNEYGSSANTSNSLSPNVAMPDGAVVITRDNIAELNRQAQRQQLLEQTKTSDSTSGQSQSALQDQGIDIDYGAEFNN